MDVKPGPNGDTFHQRATATTRCMTQAAPHHLPHDLSVQGGEMHHVQIKDQIDGIVLDLRMFWDLGQNPTLVALVNIKIDQNNWMAIS